MKKRSTNFSRVNLLVFIFLIVSVFTLYRGLFNFYFEADEWFHFTYYLPLTRQADGFLIALTSTIINAGPLSGGQHVVPIASLIYFLNTKFFGLNYVPYAFMSLLLHAVNSFLIFLFIKLLLNKKEELFKNFYAFLGAIFFALAPTPMHAVTGAAPFYGQNILSVTFFLLCIILFKIAFIKRQIKFIYLSILFLFLSLFTKETSVFLFLLLPFMALIEKRIFSFKFLGKIFLTSIIIYVVFRFLIPNVATLQGKGIQKEKFKDTGTIVSRDLSIYKNLPEEVMLRTVTFPIRMTGTLFLPRTTVFSIVQFITPVIVPTIAIGESSAALSFIYGSGNFVVIYLVSLGILIFCARQIFRFVAQRRREETKALATGLAIILLSALPLVAIIFSFPRWGYDFYFDSRFYYNPNVGAAIVFPFLIFGIAKFFSKSFNIKSVSIVTSIFFLVWLVNNMYVFGLTLNQFVNRFGTDRKEIINQIKNYLPVLPPKTVFYFETDGLSAFGPVLPFYTSVPQALAVSYYNKSPLPDSFLTKPLFNGKSQGYFYSQDRGLGYYTSKKDLAEALSSNLFSVDDVYGFYYYAQKVKLKNITPELRKELANIKK